MLVQANFTRPISLASNPQKVSQNQKRLEVANEKSRSFKEVKKKRTPRAKKVDYNLKDQVKKLAAKIEKTQQYTKSASTVIASNLLQGNSLEVSA